MPAVERVVPVPVRQAARRVLPTPVWARIRSLVRGQTSAHRAMRRGRLRAARVATMGLDGTTVIELRGQTYVARKVDSFRADDVLKDHLDIVTEALEAHGVAHFVLETSTQRRRIVVVASTDRAAASAALRTASNGLPVYTAVVKNKALGTPHLLRRSALPRRASVIRVFQVLASPCGSYLGGPELGCDIEFWKVSKHDRPAQLNGEPMPAGSLVAPRFNDWAEVVTPGEQETVLTEMDGALRRTLKTIQYPHLFTVTEPIDVVYTWVDGDDPEWLRSKAAAADSPEVKAGALHALAANDSRYVSRDELKYSLRSLDMYADWVRHVYLVTADQVPEWLDTDNPRISVVSHRELFGDRGQLPTFNSHAIESQLHHAPGLSEQFLYLNDDVFFGRPVAPDLFFRSNGLAIFSLSNAKIGLGPADPDDMPVMSAAKNNRDLIAGAFQRTITNKFKHVPHALRRSVLEDLERVFSDEFNRTAASTFRNHSDLSIPAALAHYYGYATGRAIPGRVRYFYADIAREDTPGRLETLLHQRDYDVFCLNDHDSSRLDVDAQAKIIGDFLGEYFPLPSSFERQP